MLCSLGLGLLGQCSCRTGSLRLASRTSQAHEGSAQSLPYVLSCFAAERAHTRAHPNQYHTHMPACNASHPHSTPAHHTTTQLPVADDLQVVKELDVVDKCATWIEGGVSNCYRRLRNFFRRARGTWFGHPASSTQLRVLSCPTRCSS